MFANNLDTITTESMKVTSFVFGTIVGFIFGAIAGFVFGTIVGFVFVAINLLHDHGGKYLLQIKVRLKETVVYLDRSYSHHAYLYQYLCYKC